jgi:hypothetical protein
MRCLLDDGRADPDARSGGSLAQGPASALFAAAAVGHFAACQLLLDRGAPPNGGRGDLTPLYISAHQGHADVAELLLARGAHPQGAQGALLAAAGGSSSGKPGGGGGGGRGGASLCYARGGGATGGKSPLHAAAGRGHCAAVAALLAGGADPRAVDAQGRTPLQAARRKQHAPVVAQLLLKLRPSTTSGSSPHRHHLHSPPKPAAAAQAAHKARHAAAVSPQPYVAPPRNAGRYAPAVASPPAGVPAPERSPAAARFEGLSAPVLKALR